LDNMYEDRDKTFTTGFRKLCESIENEAKLSPVGRTMIRAQLDIIIEGRLRIGSWLATHASSLPKSTTASNQEAFGPVFILGMPRSGSTFLHNLLSHDTRLFRAPRVWEIVDPIPPLGDGDEIGLTLTEVVQRRARLAFNSMGTSVFRFLSPNLEGVHPVSSTNAEECMPILGLSMLSYHFQTIMDVPTYQRWLMDQPDQTKALEWHARYLRSMNTSKHWLLKAPWHMNHIESILKVYPKARIIVTHRDPTTMISSLSSLITRLHGVTSDELDLKGIGASTLSTWDTIVDRFVEQRKRIDQSSHKTNILDLSHSVLNENPMRAVKDVYAFLGLTLDSSVSQAMQDWLDKDVHLGKKGASKQHVYDAAWFGLNESELRTKIKSFQKYSEIYIAKR